MAANRELTDNSEFTEDGELTGNSEFTENGELVDNSELTEDGELLDNSELTEDGELVDNSELTEDGELLDDNITADIITYLRENGASLIGIAGFDSLDSHPSPALPKAIVYGVALDSEFLRKLIHGPDSGYSAECTRANGILRELSTKLVAYLGERGFEAVSPGPTTDNFDKEKLSVDFPHKTAATRAGLDWVGKCDLLVTEKFGSAIRLNTVFTNAPLRAGTPVERSFCGGCTRCVEACPAGAISGKEWYPGCYRDEFLDIKACYKKCQEYFDKNGKNSSICGICIAACPWTMKYLKKTSSIQEAID